MADRKIKITAEFLAQLKGMDDVVSKMKTGLQDANKEAIKSTNFTKLFSDYTDEYKKFKSFIGSDGIDILDSKEALRSGEKIIKLFKQIQSNYGDLSNMDVNLAKKLFPSEFTGQAKKAQEAIDNYENTVQKINGLEINLQEQRIELERLRNAAEAAKDQLNAINYTPGDLEKLRTDSANAALEVEKLQKQLRQKLGLDENADLEEELAKIKKNKEEYEKAQQAKKDYAKNYGDNKTIKEIREEKKELEELVSLMKKRKELSEPEKERFSELSKKTGITNQAEAGKKTKTLNAQMDYLSMADTSSIDMPDEEINKMSEELEKASIKSTQLKKSLEETGKEAIKFAKAQKDYGDKNAAYEKTKLSVEQLDQQLTDLKNSQGNITALFNTLNQINANPEKLAATSENLEKIKKNLSNMDETTKNRIVEKLQEMGLSAEQAERQVDELRNSFRGMGDEAKEISKAEQEMENLKNQMLQFVGLTNSINLFKRAVQSAINTVKELDAVMTETAVVTDFTIGDMWEKLPEYAAEATKLGTSIKDLYAATTLYYQQGLKTEAAMGVGIETMKMARIANMDATDATTAMTAALRGFNMEVNEMNATRVNDVYSELAAITAADTNQIATAMGKTASIAASANMEFETTAALLAQIIETTQEAPETAGTAMKTIIARFTEVKELFSEGMLTGEDSEGEEININKIDAALRTVGISLKDFLNGSKGIDDIFLELASKWDDLDLATQRYIATMAAGSRQQSRFIAMMSNYDRTMELVNAANNSAGASQEQFNKTLDSLDAKLQKLQNAWNEFTMGLANNELVKVGVDILTGALNIINGIIEALSGGNGLSKSIITLAIAISAVKGASALLNKFFNSKLLKTITKSFGQISQQAKTTGTEAGENIRSGIKTGLEATVADAASSGTKSGQAYAQNFKAQTQGLGVDNTNIDANALVPTSKGIKVKVRKKTETPAANTDQSNQQPTQDKAMNATSVSAFQLTGILTTLAGAGLNWGASAMKATDETSALAAGLEGAGTTATIAGSAISMLAPFLAGAEVALGPLLIGLAALVGVVALVAAGIKAAYNASLEGRIEAAEKATERAKTAAEEAKVAYDNLLTSKDTYDDLGVKLESLTKGTQAWKEALQQSNDEVLKLLELYPELKDAVKYEEGRLTLDEEKYSEIMEEKQQQTTNAATTLAGNELEEKYLKSRKFSRIFNLLVPGGNFEGELGDTLLDAYEKNPEIFESGESKSWKEIEDQFLDKENTAVDFNQLKEWVNNSSTVYKIEKYDEVSGKYAVKVGNDTAEYTSEQIAKLIPSIQMFDSELYELAKKTGLASNQLTLAQENLREGVEDREDYQKEVEIAIYSGVSGQLGQSFLAADSSNAVLTGLGRGLSDNINDEFNKAQNNLNIVEIAESYDLEGRTESDATYREVYTKATGQSAEVISIDQIKKELASLEVFKQIGSNAQKLINGIESAPKEDAEILKAGIGKDASTLTREDLNNFKNDYIRAAENAYGNAWNLADSLGMTWDEFGSDIDNFVTTQQAEFKQLDKGLLTYVETGQGLKYVDYSQKNLALEDYKVYSDLIGKILAEGGVNAANSFEHSYNTLLEKGNPEMDKKFQNLLKTIDFSPKGIEDFSKELEKIGYNIEDSEIEGFVSSLRDLGRNLQRIDLKKFAEDSTALLDLADKISEEQKRTFSQEDYEKIVNSGVAKNSEFFWTGEEWAYLGDSLQELTGAIRENTVAKAEENLQVLGEQIKSGQDFANYAKDIEENHQSMFLSGKMDIGYVDEIRKYMKITDRNMTDAEVMARYEEGLTNYNSLATNTEQYEKDAPKVRQMGLAQEVANSGIQISDEFIFPMGNSASVQQNEKFLEQKAAIDAVALSTEGAMGQYAKWSSEMKNFDKLNEKEKLQLKQLAIFSTKYADSVDNLAEALSDEIDILKKGDKAGDKYWKALEKIAVKAQGVFGPKVTAEFVASNKDLFVQLGKGGEAGKKAFQQLAQKAAEGYLNGLAPDDLAEKTVEVLNNETLEGVDGVKTILDDFFANNQLELGEAINISDLKGQYHEWYDELMADPKVQETLRIYGYVVSDGKITKAEDGSEGFKIKNTGSGSSKSNWENPYDKFYNTLREINEELRVREQLERRYQNLIKTRSSSANDLYEVSQKEIEQLEKEAELQEYLKKGRQDQIDELVAKKEKKYGKYVQVSEGENGEREIRINWEEIDKIKGTKKGEALEEYISQLEEWEDSIEETNDTLDDIEDTIYEINERGKDELIDVENRTKDALVSVYQKQIDALSDINESINDTNSRLLGAMQESIEQQRQARENEKTEEELSNKQRRLAYLRQDTSGANALEIMQLEKELDEGMESYTDQLIDQKISELQKQNDEAAEQRERQIEIAQNQLDHYVETGAIWSEVESLMELYMDKENGPTDQLLELLKEGEEFAGLSELGKEEWMNDLGSTVAQALAYVMGINQLENLDGMAGKTIEVKDKNGNSYTGTVDDKGNFTGQDADGNNVIFKDVYQDYNGSYITTENAEKGQENYIQITEDEAWAKDPTYYYTTSKGKKIAVSEISSELKKGSTGNGVRALQWALKQLGYRDTGLFNNFGNDTEADLKAFQKAEGIDETGKLDDKTRTKFRLKGYKTGGLADFTGPAWLDGTKANPEYILNADQTKAFFELVDVLSGLKSGVTTSSQINGDSIYDVDINVESIGSDYDVEQLAQTVKRMINDDARYRNNNAINLSR